MRKQIERWIADLKREIIALWFAYRHPDTPWYAKLWAALVVGYALSPIDLIPDFIPIIGFLDDLILVPAGIWVALKLIPPHAIEAGRAQARDWLARNESKPRNFVAAALIVVLWVLALALLGVWLWREYGG